MACKSDEENVVVCCCKARNYNDGRKWSKIDWNKFNQDFKESRTEDLVTQCEDINACAEFLTATCRVHLDTQEQGT